VSIVASTPVQNGMTSLRTRIAITASSSEALPARSPMPLMVHSIWRAPARTPASEFATAMRDRHGNARRSAPGRNSAPGRAPFDQREIFLRHRVADGIGNVDRGGAGLDRGFDAAAEEIVLGARAVLARPLDIVVYCARGRPSRSPSRRPSPARAGASTSCAPARWR